MHFRSTILISQRKVTPSQHAQTRKNRKQKKNFPIFCRQKLVKKFSGPPQPAPPVRVPLFSF